MLSLFKDNTFWSVMGIIVVMIFLGAGVRQCALHTDPRAQAQSGLEHLYGPEVRVACFQTGGPAVACLLRMPDGQMRSVRCDYSAGCTERERESDLR